MEEQEPVFFVEQVVSSAKLVEQASSGPDVTLPSSAYFLTSIVLQVLFAGMLLHQQHLWRLDAIGAQVTPAELIDIIAKQVRLAKVPNSHFYVVDVDSFDGVGALLRLFGFELQHHVVTLYVVMGNVVLVDDFDSFKDFQVNGGVELQILPEGVNRIALSQAPLPQTTVVLLHHDVVASLVRSEVIQVGHAVLVAQLL